MKHVTSIPGEDYIHISKADSYITKLAINAVCRRIIVIVNVVDFQSLQCTSSPSGNFDKYGIRCISLTLLCLSVVQGVFEEFFSRGSNGIEDCFFTPTWMLSFVSFCRLKLGVELVRRNKGVDSIVHCL